MYKIIFFAIATMLFCTAFANAQTEHKVYIQSEDGSKYTVVYNGKIYAASDAGYVAVTNIKDNKMNFFITFPKNKYSSQVFNCILSQQQAYYTLKQRPNKSWTLVAGNSPDPPAPNPVNDDTLTKNPPPTSIVSTVTITDYTETKSVSVVNKLGERVSMDGRQINQWYTDATSNGSVDTIIVLIPDGSNSSRAYATENKSTNMANKYATNTNVAQSLPASSSSSVGNNDTAFKSNSGDTISNSTSLESPTAFSPSNSSETRVIASQEEVQEIYTKIITAADDENAMSVARSHIQSKLFTTEQIKNLGQAFKNEKMKLAFFTLVKNTNATYDKHFSDLQYEFREPLYYKQFNILQSTH